MPPLDVTVVLCAPKKKINHALILQWANNGMTDTIEDFEVMKEVDHIAKKGMPLLVCPLQRSKEKRKWIW